MSELHDCIPNIVREDAIDQQKKKKAGFGLCEPPKKNLLTHISKYK